MLAAFNGERKAGMTVSAPFRQSPAFAQ